jgi:hypothetical protein
VAGGALRAFDPELACGACSCPDFPDRPTDGVQADLDARRAPAARARPPGAGRAGAARGELGYRQVFLTTGPNQPEAVALYLAAGYTELPDGGAPDRGHAVHPFIKPLSSAQVAVRRQG